MSENFDLSGRVAIVTGGARGIGRAIAEELIASGASVVIADSGVSIAGEPEDTQVAEAAAVQLGARAAALARDIAELGAAQAAVDLALQRFGALDLVINNAAILRDGFIFKAERENWERVIQTNLCGAFALLAAATPVLRETARSGRAPGRIVNMISSAGLYGNFGQAAYAAAKAGLVGLTRVTAMDLARSAIHCNAVAPFAATRVTESIRPANDAQASYKARALSIPAGYVARLVAFLCAPACTITGQIFGVRGREVFLFSQPRPLARVVLPVLAEQTPAHLEAAIGKELSGRFTDLSTDLEAFDTEPLI